MASKSCVDISDMETFPKSEYLHFREIPDTHMPKVCLTGYITGIREEKTIIFIDLSNEKSSRTIQCVLKKPKDGDAWKYTKEDLKRYSEKSESYFSDVSTKRLKLCKFLEICVYGSIVLATERAHTIEMQCEYISVLAPMESALPYSTGGEYPPEFFWSIPHLKWYHPMFQQILRIIGKIRTHIFTHLDKLDFTCVDLPLTTSSECEGGSQQLTVTKLFDSSEKIEDIMKTKDPFSKDFYGKRVYLSGSQQLLLEPICMGMGRVYCLTKAVRGEPSQTRKHVSEFAMIEYEAKFESLHENILCITTILELVMDELKEDPDLMSIRERCGLPPKIPINERHFIRITHEDAVRRMLDDVERGVAVFLKLPAYDEDISSEHEKYITDVIAGGEPVILMYFPTKVKSFYMSLLPDEQESEFAKSRGLHHVDCFDILVPRVGEIVGGSQREHRYAEIMERIQSLKLDPKPLDFYTAIRKYSCVPHGGMGLGFERLVMYMTGIPNIRDVQTYPRAMGECLC